MKLVFAILCAFFSIQSLATTGEISGTVTVAKDAEKSVSQTGVLFIIAKKAGSPATGTPPLAVLRIPQPKFPQNFTIGSAQLMMGGSFEGAMAISARYSESGDAMDKSGPEGTAAKASIPSGSKNIKIELKSKKK